MLLFLRKAVTGFEFSAASPPAPSMYPPPLFRLCTPTVSAIHKVTTYYIMKNGLL